MNKEETKKAIEVIQDNISKAEEIANSYSSDVLKAGAYFGAAKMAEWKDQQFKELLVNKLSLVRDCYQKSKTECKKDYYSAQMVVTAEIINELFGEIEQDNSDRKE